MTEYNPNHHCEEHQKRHPVQSCVWCEIQGLKEEIVGLRLELAHLKGKSGSEPIIPTPLWNPTSCDRR